MTTPKQTQGHTPGPWRLNKLNRMSVCSDDATIYGIAEMLPGYSDEQREANALLIASAPTLLKERDDLLAERDKLKQYLEMADETVWDTPELDSQVRAALMYERDKSLERESALREVNRELVEALKWMVHQADIRRLNEDDKSDDAILDQARAALSKSRSLTPSSEA